MRIRNIFGEEIPVYQIKPSEKYRIISELGIKYFIDDYNLAIHHIELNCPDRKAYWLNRGCRDFSLVCRSLLILMRQTVWRSFLK